MHDSTNNAVAGAGIALASIGGLFAQAGSPGSISVLGSVIALAFVLVRAAQEVLLKWLALRSQEADCTHAKQALADCEKQHDDNLLLAKKGRCPFSGDGSPLCLGSKG